MLNKIDLFSGLDRSELKRLESISLIKKYGKNEPIFYQNESPKYLSVLLSGEVKIFKTTPKNKEIFLHNIRPVNLIAELANFENINYPASAVATEISEVLRIDYSIFEKEFLLNPKICFKLLKSLCKKMRILNEAISINLMLDSQARVAKLLLDDINLFNSTPNNKIANMLNISAETLSRTISQFRSNGLIDGVSEVEIINKNALMELIKE